MLLCTDSRGIPHIFAEYVDGGSLKQSIRQGRLYEGGEQHALNRILNIAIQFARGLHAAHEQRLVHQDIKPDNVLLTSDGIVKVSDFGLARMRALIKAQPAEAEGEQTEQESLPVSRGGMTPAYCSPEQAAGRPLTRKTDIWSWAVSVLEMFTGGVTWKMGPMAAALLEHPPEEVRWQVQMPEEVRSVLLHCLQREPEARPATMAEVIRELMTIYAHLSEGGQFRLVASFVAKTPEKQVEKLLNQAVSLGELGQFEEALLLYEQAIRLNPYNPVTYLDKGGTLFKQGKLEQALLAYERALELDPHFASVYHNKGRVLHERGKLGGSIGSL